jgi:hypothetical protein
MAATAYGPTRRASDGIVSLAAYARGVNLCFLQHGPELADPDQSLRGSGKVSAPILTQQAAEARRR